VHYELVNVQSFFVDGKADTQIVGEAFGFSE
jgi:hypothetical protein